MALYRMDLAYDGSGFRGYARQPGQRTVQGELERGLETLLGFTPETAVAGRTDAGVHARGQVVSFGADQSLDEERFRRSLDGLLGPEIAVKSLAQTEDGFHARFSAISRRYRYLLDCGTAADPLSRHVSWHVGPKLDRSSIEAGTGPIVGEHDFSSFCRDAAKSNVRSVFEAAWEFGEDRWILWIEANSFCHQMVRSVVGHLYDIGRGYAEAGSTPDVIAARDRSAVATVAPPHGLTLWGVGYPEETR